MDDSASRLSRILQRLAHCRSAAEPRPVDAQAVLLERARHLARKIPLPTAGDFIEVVQFRLGNERLAVESAWVREVFTPREVLSVPGTPPFIAGIINHRGSILSVIDLRKVLELSPAPGKEPQVVLYLGGGEMEFGVLIEEVEAARQVHRGAIAAPPPTLPEAATHYLRGVLPGPVSLLDARLLLAAPQLLVE